MAIAADSPTAIRLYVFFAALLVGVLIAVFVIVPSSRRTCTWFTSRCSTIEVTTVPNSRMLRVHNARSGQTYVYDGTYIFSYGVNVPGTCPTAITTGTSPTPLPLPTIDNFCYVMKYTPDDPECKAGNVAKCAQCASPTTQCARLSTWNEAKGGYMCNPNSRGEVATASPKCCATITGCTNGAQCTQPPTYDAATKRYACGNITSTTPKCCKCSAEFTPITYGGSTQASGDILQPVYAIDASTMNVLDRGNGVVCAPSKRVMSGTFAGGSTQSVRITVPDGQRGLDVYQIFDVLQKRGLFVPPS